jgi:hypothetical protein
MSAEQLTLSPSGALEVQSLGSDRICTEPKRRKLFLD